MNVMHKANPAQAITTNTIAAIRSLLNFRESVFIVKEIHSCHMRFYIIDSRSLYYTTNVILYHCLLQNLRIVSYNNIDVGKSLRREYEP